MHRCPLRRLPLFRCTHVASARAASNICAYRQRNSRLLPTKGSFWTSVVRSGNPPPLPAALPSNAVQASTGCLVRLADFERGQLFAFSIIPFLSRPKNAFEIYNADNNFESRIPSLARQMRVQVRPPRSARKGGCSAPRAGSTARTRCSPCGRCLPFVRCVCCVLIVCLSAAVRHRAPSLAGREAGPAARQSQHDVEPGGGGRCGACGAAQGGPGAGQHAARQGEWRGHHGGVVARVLRIGAV